MAVVLAAAIALWLPRLAGPIDLRYDAGVYYTVGTALADGRGYQLPSEPGGVPEIQYPPALPALAAIVQGAVGTGDPAVAGHVLRLLCFALSTLYAAAVYLVARRLLRPSWSAFAALLTVVHYQQVFLSDLLFAELPYALVTMLFLLAVVPRRGDGRRGAPPGGAWRPALLGSIAFLLRTAGVAVLGAWVLDALVRRRWRHAALAAAVAALCVGGWQLHVRRASPDPAHARDAYLYQRAPYQYYNVGYVDNLRFVDPFRPELGQVTARQLAARVPHNLGALASEIGLLVTAKEMNWVVTVQWGHGFWARVRYRLATHATLALSLLPLAGLLLLARRGHRLVPLYVLGSLALIAVTPWGGQYERYLLPLRPLLLVSTALTLRTITTTLRRRAGRRWGAAAWVPAAGITGVVLVVQLHAVWQTFAERSEVSYRGRDGRTVRYHLFWYDRRWQLHDAAIDWVARHAAAGDVVITSTPHWVYLRAGLRSVLPPFEADPRRALELMSSVPDRRYLVVDQLTFLDVTRRYAAPVVHAFPHRWRLVFQNGPEGSSVFEYVGPEAETRSPPGASIRAASLSGGADRLPAAGWRAARADVALPHPVGRGARVTLRTRPAAAAPVTCGHAARTPPGIVARSSACRSESGPRPPARAYRRAG